MNLVGDCEFSGTKRFVIQRPIGAGGMGVVYEVYDRDRQTTVALKTLRRLGAINVTRFQKEFSALQGLSHPNLVELGELCHEGNCWLFTMELVKGVDFLS